MADACLKEVQALGFPVFTPVINSAFHRIALFG
jgi:hypothetical protein